MAFWNKYPYTDFHELNLDWVLKTIKLMDEKLDNFINLNEIKYADPIEWDITSQYQGNTVVLDDVNHVAYLSIQAVPAGVALTNTNYWIPILDLRSFYDGLDALAQEIGDLAQLQTLSRDNLVNAINEVLSYVGNISTLHTENKSSTVNAINEISAEAIPGIAFNKPQFYDNISGLQSLGYNTQTDQYVGFSGVYPSIYLEVLDSDLNLLTHTAFTQCTATPEDVAYDEINDGYWFGDNSPASIRFMNNLYNVTYTYTVSDTVGVLGVACQDDKLVAICYGSDISTMNIKRFNIVSGELVLVDTIPFTGPFDPGIQGMDFDGKYIYACQYVLHGDTYTNLLYIINAETGEYKAQFLNYFQNNSEAQGVIIQNNDVLIYGFSVVYSGNYWWLSRSHKNCIGNITTVPSIGSGTPKHYYVNEDATVNGDGLGPSTPFNDFKYLVPVIEQGIPVIASVSRLHKGSGETLLFYGAHISIEGDSTVSDYNLLFSNCKVTLTGGVNTNRKIEFDHSDAVLNTCVCTDLVLTNSDVKLDGCYLWNTPTLTMTCSKLFMINSSSAAAVTGNVKASIIVNDMSTPMAITLSDGSQHFI